MLREVYPLPTVDETLAQLTGATVFSKPDANSGFWQISLADSSQLLTTFITPLGCYCFNKLPFGISSAPEFFQKWMDQILDGLDGVLCQMDDVLVFGSNSQEHDFRLHAVLKASYALNTHVAWCLYAVGQPKELEQVRQPKVSEKVNIPTFNPSTTDGYNSSAMVSLATLSRRTNANSTSVVPVGPIAGIPARLARRILDLEFIEICDLLQDFWQEETQQLLVLDSLHLTPRPMSRKAPVHDIGLCIECFSRMAAILVSCYPNKAPEMFAYQATIFRAARNFEGNLWVAYDHQYRREAHANRDLNWSQMNTRLYNEAFTGRTESIPRCRHCLSDTHTTTNCPLEPNLGGAVSTQPPFRSTIPAALKSAANIIQGDARILFAAIATFAKGALTHIRRTSVRRTAQEQATHLGSDRQQEREMAIANLQLVDVCCAIAFHYFAHAVQDVQASYRCMVSRVSTLIGCGCLLAGLKVRCMHILHFSLTSLQVYTAMGTCPTSCL